MFPQVVFFNLLQSADFPTPVTSVLYSAQVFNLTAELVWSNPHEACGVIQNSEEVRGQIALIESQGCSFEYRIRTLQEAGAIGIVWVQVSSSFVCHCRRAVWLPFTHVIRLADSDRTRHWGLNRTRTEGERASIAPSRFSHLLSRESPFMSGCLRLLPLCFAGSLVILISVLGAFTYRQDGTRKGDLFIPLVESHPLDMEPILQALAKNDQVIINLFPAKHGVIH